MKSVRSTEEIAADVDRLVELEPRGAARDALVEAATKLREMEAENARLRAQIERGRCSACDHKPHPLVCPFHPPVVVQTASGEDRSR